MPRYELDQVQVIPLFLLQFACLREILSRVLFVFTTQVTGLTQSFGESATKMGEDIQQKVNSLAAFDLEVRNS